MKYLNYFVIAGILVLFSCNRGKDNFQYKLLPVKTDNKWGYIDNEGKIIINPQFEEAFLFTEDIALVKDKNKYGYISDDGKVIINPMYVSATYFSDGMALAVTENGYPTFIDKKGEIKFTVNEADVCRLFKEDLAAFKSNLKWGFIDKTGKIMINAQFDKVDDFSEGLAAFGNETNQKMQFGYINEKGEIKINLQFDEAYSFEDGLALVKLNEKYGFIDEDGKFVINAQFDYASPFRDDLSLVKVGDKFGFIDKKGKIVINPQFDKVGSFNDGLALVISEENKFGYINKKGEFEINAQFDEAYEFRKDLAPVKQNEKYGFIDTKGKIVINPQFDAVYDSRFYKNYVYSDYFNTKSLVAYFMDKTSDSTFRGINRNTTFGNISNDIHKNDKVSESTNYSLTVMLNKDIDNYIKIENIKYFFSDKIYSITTTYKFLYHWGNYPTGTKKDMNFDSKVNAVEIEMYTYGKGSGKNDKIVKELGNSFTKLLNTTASDITDGLLIESSALKVEITKEKKLLTGKIYLKVSFK